MGENAIDKHESYGAMQLSRGQRPATALFGSSIKHENTIRLKISSAEIERKHHTDFIFSSHSIKDTYIEVEMSYSQFAEAITSLNQGTGVPVTIRYANGRRTEPCPFTSKDEQFRTEFEADLDGLAATADDAVKYARALFDSKKPLTKAEKEELLSMLSSVSQTVKSNIPFIRDCFVEQMDKTVTEAKGNFEGFVQNRMNEMANAAIAQSLTALRDGGGSAALLGFDGNLGGESDTPKHCKLCGGAMVWENPNLKGHFQESSCNIEGWPVCHDCMIEHCCNTDCSACKYGNVTDCRFHDLKKHYMGKD